MPRVPGLARQTPRVSIRVGCEAYACTPMGGNELRHLRDWDDRQPGTELNFKLYRQATNKIAGISAAAAALRDACC